MSHQWCIRLIFVLFFFLMVIILYLMLDSINTDRDKEQKSIEQQINERLDYLEDSIRDLDKNLKEERQKIKQRLKLLIQTQTTSLRPQNKSLTTTTNTRIKHVCTWRSSSTMNTTFEVRQLYDTLPFDDKNGGVWSQGFDIQYNSSQWTSTNKLKVIIMPHSHCDPGWRNTFEMYFRFQTRHVLDTMIDILSKNNKYKFIWAEMSFLNLWWNQATKSRRELLIKLINNKQFEIVTGGWVMNDEANTHYFSMLDQLIEGHQFIEHKLGNIPLKSSWANDPFGYSPTMAYLLERSGIQYMAIQRVHYHIKKALAKEKQLEFFWQQAWDRDISTRIFTHVLPFRAYDIPHTCGPDPKICCQFDFKRAYDPLQRCTWGKDPVPITEINIQERAQLLLDQYRKKSQLYRTNILFIQLGDDFRYTTELEAKTQFDNYDKLITYMNQQIDWNIHIEYGTLSDYFEKVFQDKSIENFPSYSGDFFTYADHATDYWSGYYTSRSFFKRMNRIVESYVRTTEILFSSAYVKVLEQQITSIFPVHDLFDMLVVARRNLAIFQHHDGITGTSKDHVVNDFGRKLLQAMGLSQTVMLQSVAYLMFQDDYSIHRQYLIPNQEFETYDRLPIKKLIPLKNELNAIRIVYIHNPTDQKRNDIVKILLDTYQVYVTSQDELIFTCQIDPKWSNKRSNIMEPNQFELLIQVDVEPYSIKEYTIHSATSGKTCPLTKLQYIDKKQMPKKLSGPFELELIPTKLIQINNRILSITFSKTGAILDVQHKKNDEKIRFHTNIIHYGTSKQPDHHSGAYIFIPDDNAQDIPISNSDLIRIQQGSLISQLNIIHEKYGLQYKLTNTNGSDDYVLKISAIIHLNMNKDTEIALRFSTGIKNGDEFFTDLNGFQMIRRKTYEKLPIQGNVYPMPTMAYIEDDSMRFTILAGQPSGVSCLKSGVIDIFLDRRLTQDDGRGLGQGVMDNREVISTFQLLFEPRDTTVDRTSLTGYPTLLAHHLSLKLLYPMYLFHSLTPRISLNELNLFSKSSLFPSDYHLVNFRTLSDYSDDIKSHPSQDIALILRRFAYDCDEDYDNKFDFKKPTFEDFFQKDQIESIYQTSLSLRYIKQTLNITSLIHIPYSEIVTYKIRFS